MLLYEGGEGNYTVLRQQLSANQGVTELVEEMKKERIVTNK